MTPGSFISGKMPSLLSNFDDWWFESVETSAGRWEWESVERTFGISRAMVELVARITSLDARKRRIGLSLRSYPEEMEDVVDLFRQDSETLLLELEIWGSSLSALPQNARVTVRCSRPDDGPPLITTLQCGDYIHKYMSIIFISADILEDPPATPRVQSAIDCVLELVSEASAMRMSVMLVWPLLIAGAFCLSEKRDKVRELFEAFRYDYCEDLEAAVSTRATGLLCS